MNVNVIDESLRGEFYRDWAQLSRFQSRPFNRRI